MKTSTFFERATVNTYVLSSFGSLLKGLKYLGLNQATEPAASISTEASPTAGKNPTTSASADAESGAETGN